jgi:hypothetical protein
MLRGLYTLCSVFESIASTIKQGVHMSLYHSSDRLYCLLYDMYNFNPLGPKLNRPHDLHLYTIVPDLVVKAMDKIKNLSTILFQIVDI